VKQKFSRHQPQNLEARALGLTLHEMSQNIIDLAKAAQGDISQSPRLCALCARSSPAYILKHLALAQDGLKHAQCTAPCGQSWGI
jgi:hypothetical protein